jgi:predicted TIM-barrel fold metal-dependent hydrolase
MRSTMPHGPLIDIHQHPVPESYKRAMAQVGIAGSGENAWPEWSVEAQLALMDECGIAVAINSIASPGCYFGDTAFAARVARECNEVSARQVADRPDRFGAFALLPLPDVGGAVREAVYALDMLKLDGICLLTHAGPNYLGHPDEGELYAELDRRRAVVFIHPLRAPGRELATYQYPAGMTELVFDTTRAIHNLLWGGVFAKFPNIRWIMPHGGGTVPFLTYRMRQMNHKARERLPGGSIDAALRGLYYDIAEVAAPAPLAALMQVADRSRILFGSDFPFSRHRNPAQDVRDIIAGYETHDGFDAATRTAIERDNALALFPRFKKVLADAGK